MSLHLLRTWIGRIALAASVVATVLSASCNMIAPLPYLIRGQPKTEPVYVLPDKPTVVFVDDRSNVIAGRVSLRRIIADTVSEDLMVEKVVTKTISPRDTITIAQQQDKAGKPLPMDELALKVGADQMIYVQMTSFQLSPDGITPRPRASCEVRIIDAAAHVKLFPTPGTFPETYPIEVDLGEIQQQQQAVTASMKRELEEKLAQALGQRIGQMFYAWTPDEIGTRLNPE